MTEKSEACDPPTHVAVVGAGAAGLVAARELRREGHEVDVFEQQRRIGGVWVLDSGAPDGPDVGERKIHTSMYDGLRVNLPRELMGFSDFPFVPEFMQGRSVDPRRFPHHTEVRQYLEAFADHFGVRDAVHLDTQVTGITPIRGSSLAAAGSRWRVRTASVSGGRAPGALAGQREPTAREYDAVVICNGHYTVPRMPKVEGLERYPGQVEHSHLYRRPEVYSGKRVLIIGAFATGEDVAWEIARVAESVTMSAKTWMLPHYAEQTELFGERCNMRRRPWVAKMHADGFIDFEDGTREGNFDVVIFCTGYEYTLPFLEDGTVDGTGGCVSPLYQHLLHPSFGASLSFIGLGFKNVPFPQCEMQSKYVAALLSGKAETPSQEAMEDWIKNETRSMEENGTPRRHMHCMALTQFQYNDALAAKCGGTMTPAWRLALVKHTMELWGKYTAIQYRDQWTDEESLTDSHAAFKAMKQSTVHH